jgi:magnesium-dependent phosphatase 1
VSHIGFGICAMTFRGFVLHSECRSKKENPSLYPEAMGILNALKQKGVTMAVASRTPTPDIANCFLNKLGIPSFFADMQIYPSYTHKVEHFQKIRQNTGIPYKSMLFFDDESRNIQSVSLLFLFLSRNIQ